MLYILRTDTKTFCQPERAPKKQQQCSSLDVLHVPSLLHAPHVQYVFYLLRLVHVLCIICSMCLKCLTSLCCNTCCMCLLCLICHEYHIDLRRYIQMYLYMSTTLTYVCTMPRTLSPRAPCLGRVNCFRVFIKTQFCEEISLFPKYCNSYITSLPGSWCARDLLVGLWFLERFYKGSIIGDFDHGGFYN